MLDLAAHAERGGEHRAEAPEERRQGGLVLELGKLSLKVSKLLSEGLTAGLSLYNLQ